jgi:hypothetical protein
MMDVEKENEKACKKEEKGEVEEKGKRVNGPGQVQPVDALCEERTDVGSFVWTIAWLCHLDIPAGPLL